MKLEIEVIKLEIEVMKLETEAFELEGFPFAMARYNIERLGMRVLKRISVVTGYSTTFFLKKLTTLYNLFICL